MKHPAPICATVSRRTGEVRIEWADDLDIQVRFGRVMNRLNRIAEAQMDLEARQAYESSLPGAGADAFRGAAAET